MGWVPWPRVTLPALEVGVAVRGDTDQTVQVVGGGKVLAALRGLEPLHILLWNVSKVRLRAKHEQASRPPACEESQPSSRRCAGVPCCRPPPRLTAPPLDRRATRRRSRCKQHVAIELPLRHRWDALQDVHLFSLSSSSLSVENSIRHRRELLRKAHLLHLEVGVIEFLL
jgi:hypothetical protein